MSLVPDPEQQLWRTVTRRRYQLSRHLVRLRNQLKSLLEQALQELELVEEQILELDETATELMQEHRDAVQRVAQVPGFGVDSALQTIAEVGPAAAAFDSENKLCSWAGVCPGNEQSTGETHSTRSAKGNRHMRRLLNQAAQSAVTVRGSIFEVTFQRLLPRLGYKQAIWAIAHRLCRLLWLILHEGERGPRGSSRGA